MSSRRTRISKHSRSLLTDLSLKKQWVAFFSSKCDVYLKVNWNSQITWNSPKITNESCSWKIMETPVWKAASLLATQSFSRFCLWRKHISGFAMALRIRKEISSCFPDTQIPNMPNLPPKSSSKDCSGGSSGGINETQMTQERAGCFAERTRGVCCFLLDDCRSWKCNEKWKVGLKRIVFEISTCPMSTAKNVKTKSLSFGVLGLWLRFPTPNIFSVAFNTAKSPVDLYPW